MNTQNVTLGGQFVGWGIIVYIAMRWWMTGSKRGKKTDDSGTRNFQALLPFGFAWCYGVLAVISAGGLLGYFAHFSLWGSNQIGAAALRYGFGGHAPDNTRAHQLVLTDPGHAVVGLLTIVLVCLFKFSKKLPRRDVALGTLSGVCLGLGSSIAAFMATGLLDGTNWLGTGFGAL